MDTDIALRNRVYSFQNKELRVQLKELESEQAKGSNTNDPLIGLQSNQGMDDVYMHRSQIEERDNENKLSKNKNVEEVYSSNDETNIAHHVRGASSCLLITPRSCKRNRKEADMGNSGENPDKGKRGRTANEISPLVVISDEEYEEEKNRQSTRRSLDFNASRGRKKRSSKELSDIEYEDMAVPDIMASALETLAELERMRVSSKNLQGRFSGRMKDGFADLTQMIRILAHRGEEKGDISYLKKKNRELDAKIKSIHAENINTKRDIKDLRKENEELRYKLQEIEDKEMDRTLEGRKQMQQIKKNLQENKDYPYMLPKSKTRREQEKEDNDTNIFEKIQRIRECTPDDFEAMEADNNNRDRQIGLLMQQLAELASDVREIKNERIARHKGNKPQQ